MADTPNEYLRWAGIVIDTLLRDKVRIIAFTLVLAALGAAAGKLSNSATSTSNLLLTPLALQQAKQETTEGTKDPLAQMLSDPLDVTTVSLICKSDETLTTTMQKLNESGQLEAPIEDINSLDSALEFNITVSKDTPYITEYSPILQLLAQWGDSKGAKLVVDTWAEVCVASAERYQSLQQAPAAQAFEKQRDTKLKELDAAEEALEAFVKDNNIEYVEAQINHYTLLYNSTVKLQMETGTDLVANRAMLNTLGTSLSGEEAKRTLSWTPSGKLLGLVNLPQAKDDNSETPSALSQEVINPLYDYLRQQLTTVQAKIDDSEARMQEYVTSLTEYENQINTLQAKRAHIRHMESQLQREVDLYKTQYQDAAIKNSYAVMASHLDHPMLSVLSKGAEWRMPRFRRAILFGVGAGVFGFGIAIGLSLALRLIVRPALKQQSA